MGYDLSGIKPKNDTGDYFRNNVWWWRPLWSYVCEVCDEVMSEEEMCKGTSNSGYGIDKDMKDEMLVRLKAEVVSGRALKYEKDYKKKLDDMPLEECDICKGSGKRNDEHVKGECNACNGYGKTEPFETNYPFSVENVECFIKFLENNDGFNIF